MMKLPKIHHASVAGVKWHAGSVAVIGMAIRESM